MNFRPSIWPQKRKSSRSASSRNRIHAGWRDRTGNLEARTGCSVESPGTPPAGTREPKFSLSGYHERPFMPLSVVVPVFNAEATLRPLISALASLSESIPLEVILVNDGSRDRSWEVILELAAQHSWVLGINLMK